MAAQKGPYKGQQPTGCMKAGAALWLIIMFGLALILFILFVYGPAMGW
jgi:hypothetical protein